MKRNVQPLFQRPCNTITKAQVLHFKKTVDPFIQVQKVLAFKHQIKPFELLPEHFEFFLFVCRECFHQVTSATSTVSVDPLLSIQRETVAASTLPMWKWAVQITSHLVNSVWQVRRHSFKLYCSKGRLTLSFLLSRSWIYSNQAHMVQQMACYNLPSDMTKTWTGAIDVKLPNVS